VQCRAYTDRLVYARFLFPFFHLRQITEVKLLTIFLIMLFVGLGFLTGSVWVLTAAVGALMVKIFPMTLVFFAIVAAGYLAFSYYNQR
jgi:hypothetical protein